MRLTSGKKEVGDRKEKKGKRGRDGKGGRERLREGKSSNNTI
jgi:hypothetical protein